VSTICSLVIDAHHIITKTCVDSSFQFTFNTPFFNSALNTLGSGQNRGFSRKKHRNALGFAWEFLQYGQRYRPKKRLKRCGKSSSLH